MELKSLKELDKLMQLCRKRGVLAIKIDNIEFRLDDAIPQSPTKRSTSPAITTNLSPGDITEDTKIDIPDDWDSLSDEQKLFFSSEPGINE